VTFSEVVTKTKELLLTAIEKKRGERGDQRLGGGRGLPKKGSFMAEGVTLGVP